MNTNKTAKRHFMCNRILRWVEDTQGNLARLDMIQFGTKYILEVVYTDTRYERAFTDGLEAMRVYRSLNALSPDILKANGFRAYPRKAVRS